MYGYMRICFNRASADVDWHVGHGALQGFMAAKCKQSFSNCAAKSAVQSMSPDMRTHLPCFAADYKAREQRGSGVVRLTSPLKLEGSQAQEQTMCRTMVRASCVQEHASFAKHAEDPLHAKGQLTTSVMDAYAHPKTA